MKKCNNCWITKPLDNFKSNWVTKKGTKTYKPKCKPCMNLILKNSLQDTIIMVRWKPVLVPNEKRLKKNERQNEYRRDIKTKERYSTKNKEYYHALSPEVKRTRQIQNTKLARKRRYKKTLELITQKRESLINN